MKDEINSQPVKHVIEHIKNKYQNVRFYRESVSLLSVNYPNF